MEPFSHEEREVLREIHARLGSAALAEMPNDMIPMFVRNNDFWMRPDWAESTAALMGSILEMRRKRNTDSVVRHCALPPRHEELHDLMPSGPIGFDKDNRIVTLDRFFTSPAKKVLAAFPEAEEWIRVLTARRECLRAVNVAQCLREKRRRYYIVCIHDVRDLSMAHMDRAFISRIKTLREFEDAYPESFRHLLVINAPRIFTILWKLLRFFFNPFLVAKVIVVGTSLSEQQAIFSKLGVTLDESLFPSRSPTGDDVASTIASLGRAPRSWESYLIDLHRQATAEDPDGTQSHPRPTGKQLAEGYMPEADAEFIGSLTQEPGEPAAPPSPAGSSAGNRGRRGAGRDSGASRSSGASPRTKLRAVVLPEGEDDGEDAADDALTPVGICVEAREPSGLGRYLRSLRVLSTLSK